MKFDSRASSRERDARLAWTSPLSMRHRYREETVLKYARYQHLGHAVFTVTLSTYIRNEDYALSDDMRHFWDHHFIYRVKKCLPIRFQERVDHDFVIEQSPRGCLHYHGLFAVPAECVDHVYPDGQLRRQLRKALESFASRGATRPFRVNDFLVEPASDVRGWLTYSTKLASSVTSSES